MLSLRSAAALRAARPAVKQQLRAFHIENKVNANFPFTYEGAASKKRFTVGFVGVLTFAAAAPFLASAFQIDYDGASKTKFTVAYWGLLLGVGFCGIPGLAWWLQMEKFNGNL
ncbi:hypothetical protein JCM10450v2_004745 [Rhodotorula kratochvilovae]